MDDRIITLLRDVAFDLQHPDPCSFPLAEIADLGDGAVISLIMSLSHDDPIIRRTAAHALGQLRPPADNSLNLQPAIPHLENMLATDTDCLARLHAAKAFWSITNTKHVVPVFLEALNHESVEVRRFAVKSLGIIRADLDDTLQPLTATLADSDPSICAAAAEVLAGYGAAASEALPHVERLLLEDDYTRVVAVHAILRIDPLRMEALTPVLTDALRSSDPQVRQKGAQVLGEIPVAGAMAGLPERYFAAIQQFDPIRNDDGIRLLTVMGGLVRTREHISDTQYTSVQFYCDRINFPVVLCAVTRMLRRTSGDQYADLHLHNLLSDCQAKRSLDEMPDSVESQRCSTLCDQLCQSVERSQRLCDLLAVVQQVLDRTP